MGSFLFLPFVNASAIAVVAAAQSPFDWNIRDDQRSHIHRQQGAFHLVSRQQENTDHRQNQGDQSQPDHPSAIAHMGIQPGVRAFQCPLGALSDEEIAHIVRVLRICRRLVNPPEPPDNQQYRNQEQQHGLTALSKHSLLCPDNSTSF